LWGVDVHNVMESMVLNDLYYIRNLSFFLDVSIFFNTLVTIVKRAKI
jgi:lipopolysaccharide/colanic/teichoic acid biosynthesis glycosyltransferase